MKFQNCILLNFERTDLPKAICPFNFSKSWGHNNMDTNILIVCVFLLLFVY